MWVGVRAWVWLAVVAAAHVHADCGGLLIAPADDHNVTWVVLGPQIFFFGVSSTFSLG